MMHRSLLFMIHILVILNLFLTLALIYWLTCNHQCKYPTGNYHGTITWLYWLKWKWLTLPFSVSLCVLYLLRKMAFLYSSHRPTQSEFKQFMMTNSYILGAVVLSIILFFVCSLV